LWQEQIKGIIIINQNKKAKNYAVFCFAGKKNYYFIFML